MKTNSTEIIQTIKTAKALLNKDETQNISVLNEQEQKLLRQSLMKLLIHYQPEGYTWIEVKPNDYYRQKK